ncbi:unnamed protein product [Lactuca saligna]|uniref:Importin subunit alpha n=1 Tax=Lactuca saligna TaxID=75948 RepID=A0AA35VHF2_LACSI|nr:unnamed protein product [Lactuca saligna]
MYKFNLPSESPDFGKRLTYRPISGVIAQAYGSARVKMGKTEVIPLTCHLNLLTISNITAGNKEQIQTFIEANVIGPLIHLLQNEEFDIKKEVASAISNATSGGSHDQIKYLFCLVGLENILKVGEEEKNLGRSGDVNLYAQMIDDGEGLEKIENLQSRDNSEIYEKAVKHLETYWLEEVDDAIPLGDAVATQPPAGFHFGYLWNGMTDFVGIEKTSCLV